MACAQRMPHRCCQKTTDQDSDDTTVRRPVPTRSPPPYLVVPEQGADYPARKDYAEGWPYHSPRSRRAWLTKTALTQQKSESRNADFAYLLGARRAILVAVARAIFGSAGIARVQARWVVSGRNKFIAADFTRVCLVLLSLSPNVVPQEFHHRPHTGTLPRTPPRTWAGWGVLLAFTTPPAHWTVGARRSKQRARSA